MILSTPYQVRLTSQGERRSISTLEGEGPPRWRWTAEAGEGEHKQSGFVPKLKKAGRGEWREKRETAASEWKRDASERKSCPTDSIKSTNKEYSPPSIGQEFLVIHPFSTIESSSPCHYSSYVHMLYLVLSNKYHPTTRSGCPTVRVDTEGGQARLHPIGPSPSPFTQSPLPPAKTTPPPPLLPPNNRQ